MDEITMRRIARAERIAKLATIMKRSVKTMKTVEVHDEWTDRQQDKYDKACGDYMKALREIHEASNL